MWTLEQDGTLTPHNNSADPVVIEPGNAGDDALEQAASAAEAEIVFGAFADGRGFSLARRLRTRAGKGLRLVASGHVLPDQARHAFESGFDAIRISDDLVAHHGIEAWRGAARLFDGPIYAMANPRAGIWAARHAV